jgi:hypothetical protein
MTHDNPSIPTEHQLDAANHAHSARNRSLPAVEVRDMSAAQRDWVAAAADRAEQRLRGEMPSPFRQSIDHEVPAIQLQTLIAAIMSPQVTRKQLRQLAQTLNMGRVD